MESVSDQEAFRAMHVMAKMDGLSVEPATGAAFAGLFKLIGQQVIRRDEIVVVNCSGPHFPGGERIAGRRMVARRGSAGTAAAAACRKKACCPRWNGWTIGCATF